MRATRVILIAASIGLMLASSGLDGAYLARVMSWPALGYVLNTVSDVSSEVIMYAFARIRQDARAGKWKRRLSWALLAIEAVLVFYSWFLSWRQLLIVLPAIEPVHYGVVAAITAGFVPAGLLGVGAAQALIDGKFGAEKSEDDAVVAQLRGELREARAELKQARVFVKPDFGDFVRVHAESNGRLHEMTPQECNLLLIGAGYAPVAESTLRSWRDRALEARQQEA